MRAAVGAITRPPSCLLHRRISVPLGVVAMASSAGGGAYTAITERVNFEKEIKKSKFIAIAGAVSDEQSAFSFLSQVRDSRATHNCWAYKVGDQCRSNDDGEPSGTSGKPILTAITSSGIDRVMVIVIRYFGGIKLGTGGLVRAYGGVASECLRSAPTCLVKSKVRVGVEVPFDLLGILNHQLQSFEVDDMKQDYETGKEGFAMVSFNVDFDQSTRLEDAVKTNTERSFCSLDLVMKGTFGTGIFVPLPCSQEPRHTNAVSVASINRLLPPAGLSISGE